MNRRGTNHFWLAIGVITLAAAPMVANAQVMTPDTVFGVVDNGFNGPDSFSSASLADAIFTRLKEQRSFAEWDITALDGPVIQSATITGVLNEAFTFGFGTSPATFRFDLYEGNGAADLSDFDIAGTTVGSETLAEDFDVFNVSLDVTAALQAAVDNGASYVGLRSLTIDTNVGQVDINDLVLDVTAVPEPATLTLIGLGSLLLRRRS